MWYALTRVGLPVMEEREVWQGITAPVATGETVYKEPGARITQSELKDIGWPPEKIEEDMAELSKYGSVGSKEDYDKMIADAEAQAVADAEHEAEVIARVREELARERQTKEEGDDA